MGPPLNPALGLVSVREGSHEKGLGKGAHRDERAGEWRDLELVRELRVATKRRKKQETKVVRKFRESSCPRRTSFRLSLALDRSLLASTIDTPLQCIINDIATVKLQAADDAVHSIHAYSYDE